MSYLFGFLVFAMLVEWRIVMAPYLSLPLLQTLVSMLQLFTEVFTFSLRTCYMSATSHVFVSVELSVSSCGTFP